MRNDIKTQCEQKVHDLKMDLATQRATFDDTWTLFLTSLETAVSAARTLVESKPDYNLIHTINTLMDDNGLSGRRESPQQMKEPIKTQDLSLAEWYSRLLLEVSTSLHIQPQTDMEVRRAQDAKADAKAAA